MFPNHKNMNILFVTSELPCPARNGITIPACNHLMGLASNHSVPRLLVCGPQKINDHDHLAANRTIVEKIAFIDPARHWGGKRVLLELTGKEAFFHGRRWNKRELADAIGDTRYDVAWITPYLVADIVYPLKALLGGEVTYVAGINDCMTATMKYWGKNVTAPAVSPATRVSSALRWARSFRIAASERSLLGEFDVILVQTGTDRCWVEKISGGSLADRILECSNGVDSRLFELPFSEAGTDVLFIGNLTGLYSVRLMSVISKVWPQIRENRPKTRLVVVGRNATPELRRLMAYDPRIIYHEFVEDLCEVYAEKAILLSPVFKDFGLINKVIESMAAGVAVVGDGGSFNGIPGFESNRHGIVVNNYSEMAEAVIDILNSRARRLSIAEEARSLVIKHFSWARRLEKIKDFLESHKRQRDHDQISRPL